MAVTGGKTAFEQLYQIYLTAGHGESIEVHVVDMYISSFMGFDMLGVYNVHLIELLRTF